MQPLWYGCTAELLRSPDKDITVPIVTHDMELIDRCCTHILHIENGKLQSEGDMIFQIHHVKHYKKRQ